MVEPPQIYWNVFPKAGIFILKLVTDANNPDSLVVSYYKEWFEKGKFDVSDTLSFYGNGIWYKKENGNLVTIESRPYYFLGLSGNYCQLPFVLEFDINGDVIYEFVDLSWRVEDGGYGIEQQNIATITPYLPVYVFPCKSFIAINHSEDLEPFYYDVPGVVNPNYQLKPYKLVVRMYDSGGVFQGLVPIKGIDTTHLVDSCYLIVYNVYNKIFADANGEHLYLKVERKDFYGKPGAIHPQQITNNYLLKINSDWEVVWQKKDMSFTPDYIDKNGDYIKFFINTKPFNNLNDTAYKNAMMLITDTSDFSIKQEQHFQTGQYVLMWCGITSKEEHLFCGWENEWIPPSTLLSHQQAVGIMSADYQSLRVYSNKNDGSLHYGVEHHDDRYMFWGFSGKTIFRMFLEDEDFTEINIYPTTSIEEILFLPTALNSSVFPNPSDAHTTVSVDLETAGNLTVTLNNMLGQELLEIHNGFTAEGTFTKTFSLKELPIGVYYLKIVHNGNVRVEKVIRQ